MVLKLDIVISVHTNLGEHNKWLSNVFKYEIIPLIEEYWFDDQQLIDQYTSIVES